MKKNRFQEPYAKGNKCFEGDKDRKLELPGKISLLKTIEFISEGKEEEQRKLKEEERKKKIF